MPLRFSENASRRFRAVAEDNGGLQEIERISAQMLDDGASEEQVSNFLYRKFGLPKNFLSRVRKLGLVAPADG